ncbi:hypothetical protein, conserved [Trypanosoma brucei gambiense DAL972]|uniref:Uncharacterized protein n=1 Tax=Trypanosoma brucei gambiense (strain MHOM/CI/86/DAL972) TaxID=679716 RepID=C9ZMM8_TRYB9|nr:hypothetical protein, conserved [Trypanosoma brucei gambiense DAL972]CBH10531.1 hypothetical protein, conserved [Trypanosoma brucei gambiense DAL972]|eukprot:XP_011772820.1 hypothetical protein, conserved [Trypanosoma brucei gambiense DAL972]
MAKGNEECVDLRQSWRHFMVTPVEQTHAPVGVEQAQIKRGEFTLLQRYHLVGTNADEQSLFFLSLISPNAELLRATCHLFIQLNFQYRQLLLDNEEKLTLLRFHHEEQLTSLLEASNAETRDMVVGSDVTEHFVLKHQRELEEHQEENRFSENTLLLELRQNFFTFLKASAQGTMDSLEGEPGWLKLRQNDEQHKRGMNIGYFCDGRVPVRVVELPNLLGRNLTGFRPKDPLLRPIVVDISPLTSLRECLHCLYSEERDSVLAVEEHLLRLSRQVHAVLLFIGLEDEAMRILSSNYAELFLDQESISPSRPAPCFVPLRHHRCLRVMLSTQLWGANIILLWTPQAANGRHNCEPLIVEDALNLALSWNADMFTVAVLGSAARSHATSSLHTEDPTREIPMEVLRQLQCGVGRLVFEAATMKASAVWGGSEETEQRQQKNNWDAGQTAPQLVSAREPQLEFNLPMSIRVFLPTTMASLDESGDRSESLELSLQGGGGAAGRVERHGFRQDEDVGDVSVIDSSSLTDVHSIRHTTNSSFSSNIGSRRETDRRGRRQMTFGRLLAYNFGESAVLR